MSKWIIRLLAFAVIIAALIFAPQFIGEQGYVLISFGHWTLEGSVFQFVAFILLSLAALYILVKLAQYVFLMLIWPTKWWQKFHTKKNTSFYQNGLNLMALGQWQLAAEEFLKVRRTDRIESARALGLICAAHSHKPAVANKVQSALKLSELEALGITSDTPVDVPFAQLVIACQNNQYDKALTMLETLGLAVLKQTVPFQQLWLEINIYTHNWAEVDSLLPKINKQIAKQYSPEAYEQWQEQLTDWFARGFSDYVTAHSLNKLEQAWTTMQKHNRQLPALLYAYTSALAKAQQSDKVEALILEQRKSLSNAFILKVVRRYYQINHAVHMDKLFARIQKQLSNSPDDINLTTLLGYLAAGQRDHQLAKQALQKVVFSQNNVTDSKLYAQELALLGETQKSLEVYHSL